MEKDAVVFYCCCLFVFFLHKTFTAVLLRKTWATAKKSCYDRVQVGENPLLFQLSKGSFAQREITIIKLEWAFVCQFRT